MIGSVHAALRLKNRCCPCARDDGEGKADRGSGWGEIAAQRNEAVEQVVLQVEERAAERVRHRTRRSRYAGTPCGVQGCWGRAGTNGL